MPISFTRSYQASDGKCYSTLDEAQTAEITDLLRGSELALTDEKIHEVSGQIVAHKEEIVNVLTLNDSSRPKARGVRKPRKAKAAPAQPEVVTAQGQ